jgi:hypothetical protein
VSLTAEIKINCPKKYEWLTAMTPEEIIAELRACLALRNEIADKHLELAARYKAGI